MCELGGYSNIMWKTVKKLDGVILFVLLLLMAISILAIYSGTRFDPKLANHHVKTIYFYVVGFIAVIGIGLFNYKLYVKYAFLLYGIGIIFLILANVLGSTLNNANGWLKITESISFQPAELFKMILVLFLAHLIVKRKRGELGFWRDVVPIGLWTFIPFALVMAQNDLGNALGYVVILVAILWIGNIKLKHALIGLAIVGAFFIGFIKSYTFYHDEIFAFLEKIKREHWAERIDPWLVPEKATAKAMWHTKNAGLAIGSGGIMGKGFWKELRFKADVCRIRIRIPSLWWSRRNLVCRSFALNPVIFYPYPPDGVNRTGVQRTGRTHYHCGYYRDVTLSGV